MSFDTTALLSRWRLRSVLDGTETDYSDAVGLDMCDQVIRQKIVPRVLAANADYFLTYADIAVTSGRHRYPIPSRAFLGKIHSIYLLDSGKTTAIPLNYTDQRLVGLQQSGTPTNHVITDNAIVLGAIPASTGYLRVYYLYSPSRLVATTACMLVTGRSAGLLSGAAPTGWGSSYKYDIVSGTSPFELIHASLTAVDYEAGTQISFAVTDLDTDRLDDGGTYYVTIERETCFPMLPEDMHYAIADLASCPVLENQGDEGWAARYKTAMGELTELANALIMRKQTEHKPVINQFSMMRFFG